MNADLQVVPVEGGWQLVLDELWPIVTCRTRVAADAIASLLPGLGVTLPEYSIASLLALAGYTAGQSIDPLKNRSLASAWGPALTQQFYEQHGQPAFEYGGLSAFKFWLGLAGQTINLGS